MLQGAIVGAIAHTGAVCLHDHVRGWHGMRLIGNSISFGRHESFPLRFGWINKGLTALIDSPDIFTRQDATVILGVGKNMVASIRYWLQATRVARRGDRSVLVPTPIGKVVFGSKGDPYLEDEGTIWLLHWLLATNPGDATSIYWFYNHFHKPEFTSADVAGALANFVKQHVSSKVAATTLKRDANLLLRMYARSKGSARLPLEDALDSPLAILNLQERLDSRTWSAAPMDRDEIPLSIFAFAVAELFDHTSTQQLAVDQLMYSDIDHCAPGAVFRMTEDGLIRKLEALCEIHPTKLRLDRTAGIYQLYKLESLDAMAILKEHYQSGRRKLAA